LTTLHAHLRARTWFVDDQVLAAIAAGISQIVILGAGYDDRALRLRTPGVRFFELDHSDTQIDKQRRLEAMNVDHRGLTLARVDFRNRDVGAVLEAAGHDADLATLFVCEGLLVYLDQSTIIDLLVGVRARAVDGSRLTASLAVHADGLDSDLVLELANAARRTAAAEPWRTILPASAHRELVSRAGWSMISAVDDQEIEPTAAAGRSLLIAAEPDQDAHSQVSRSARQVGSP
jgi:methyltransferase (TIGR00027 family)